VILSFRDAETKRIFEGRRSKKLPFDIQRTARRKLLSLAASVNLADLAALPGNRFERLKDVRKGQYSIRINDQWRICFLWRNANAEQVEIVDYH
jgi:toxin HigB-1